MISQQRQHACEDLETQVLLVPQAIGSTLNHSNLVVQSFNEPERDFVLGFAVGGNPIPVPLNQLGELLVRFQALPFQRIAPVIKELSRPAFARVVPQLPKGFLQHVRRVQTLVGREC